MLQSKDIKGLNGYKNKTHIYVANKRPTSDQKTHSQTGMERGMSSK